MAGAGQAKTLVYCSEGIAGGLRPGALDRGHDLRRRVADRLQPADRVQAGLDRDRARPRRELGGLRGRHSRYTFHLRPGVKFQTTRLLHPDPRDQRRRRGLHLRAAVRQGPVPGTSTPPGIAWEYFNSTWHADLAQGDRQGRRHDGEVRAQPAGRHRSSPTFPMDFASIVSKEYADQLEAAGTKEQFNVSSRSAPAPSPSSTTSRTR